MEVTDNSIGYAPMLTNLLGQISPQGQLASVSGDGACDTKGCDEAIALRPADAIIPTRKNAKPWKKDRAGAAARNEILRATRRLGANDFEKVEWLPPTKFGRDENALLQAARRKDYGARL